MRCDKIIVHHPEETVKQLLSRRLSQSQCRGYIKDASFKLYMTSHHLGNRTQMRFVVKGLIQASDNETVITYTVYPTAFTLAILITMFYMLIQGVFYRVHGANNEVVLIIATLVNVATAAAVVWQKRECKERLKEIFEIV